MVSLQHPGLNAQTNIQTLKELHPTLARPWYDMLKMMLINRSLSTFHFVKGGRASISSAPSTNNIMHTGQNYSEGYKKYKDAGHFIENQD